MRRLRLTEADECAQTGKSLGVGVSELRAVSPPTQMTAHPEDRESH